MFGFLVGAVCLGGLFALRRHRPRFGGGGWGGPFGYGLFSRRGPVYAVLRRLDTTPGQEKVIRSAVADFMDSAWGMREKLKDSRHQVAQALRAETFDAERLRELVSQQVEEFVTLGTVLGVSLGRVHEALDGEQRERLARMLESSHARRCLHSTAHCG